MIKAAKPVLKMAVSNAKQATFLINLPNNALLVQIPCPIAILALP